jgi:hypothetical protein
MPPYSKFGSSKGRTLFNDSVVVLLAALDDLNVVIGVVVFQDDKCPTFFVESHASVVGVPVPPRDVLRNDLMLMMNRILATPHC